MQLVLGVAVANSVARLALVDAPDPESVHDQFDVSVAGGSTTDLVRTIVDTDRSLNTNGFGLRAVNICWADDTQAITLRDALAIAGVRNVTVVSASDAATAFVRSAAGRTGQATSALLLVDDATAALSVVGPDAATTSLIDAEEVQTAGTDKACNAMMERLREETGGAQTLYVLSTSEDAAALTNRLRAESPIPMSIADEPAYLLARGAAVSSSAGAAESPRYPTAPSPVIGEHLAYSMADDSGSLPFGVAEEYQADNNPLQTPMSPLPNVPPGAGYADDPNEIEDPVGAGRPRVLLLGSTVAAAVVVGFSVLAVGVAIAIKPTASEQAVRDYEAVPGNYLPPMPGQGVEPVEDAAVYLPPVVPISATPVEAARPAVYPDSGNRGPSGGYTTSSGPIVVGSAPASGGVGGAPASPGAMAGGNPQGAFRLGDWLDWLPDLPDNLTFNIGAPSGVTNCDRDDIACQAGILEGCVPRRPGFLQCAIGKGFIVPTQKTNQTPPEGCSNPVVSASCAPEPLNGPRVTDNDDEGADEPEKVDAPGQSEPTDGGEVREGGAEGGTPVEISDDGTADSPAATGTTSTPETTPATEAPKDTSTTENTSPTTTRTTKSPSPEPSTTKPPPSSTPAPEPKTTTAPPPPLREAPEPAPQPPPPVVVEAPPPPPVVVEAPPPPPPVVVEAPAPAPAPAAPPVTSGDSGGGSSSPSDESSSSDSGSSSSESEPVVTTEPAVP